MPILKKIRYHSVDQKFTVMVYGLHKTQKIKAVVNEPHLLMCRNFVHSWGLWIIIHVSFPFCLQFSTHNTTYLRRTESDVGQNTLMRPSNCWKAHQIRWNTYPLWSKLSFVSCKRDLQRGVEIERSPRMLEIRVRSPFATDLSRKSK